MSTYRRSVKQKRTQRWEPETGQWKDCAFDEPETRVRKPREGLLVVPGGDLDWDGPATIPIDWLIAQLGGKESPA